MKRKRHFSFVILLLTLFCWGNVYWANPISALNPAVNYAIFTTETNGCYVETYFLIPGTNVTFPKNDAGKLQAAVDVTILFRQGEKITNFDKYQLTSQAVDKPTDINFNLIDLKRYALPNGDYVLEISFEDTHNAENKASFTDSLTITQEKSKVNIADIVLIEKYTPNEEKPTEYTKVGYDLVPNVLNFYPNDLNRLTFYTEIYNAKSVLHDPVFLVTYSVMEKDGNKVVHSAHGFKKQNAATINPILAELDISKLPSGNYDLVVAVRNKSNDLLVEKRVFFQRAKKIVAQRLSETENIVVDNTFAAQVAEDDLTFYLKSMRPISGENEKQYIDNAVGTNNAKIMRQFLYNFWVQRNPYQPAEAFAEHKERVAFTEKHYKSQIFDGYESDRGRIYLKYGEPSDMAKAPAEPGALPHEIWQYYALPGTSQSNVKFVFYNPNTADNEYELVHSTARDEVQDPRWKMKVFNAFKERNNVRDLDNTTIRDHYGTTPSTIRLGGQ